MTPDLHTTQPKSLVSVMCEKPVSLVKNNWECALIATLAVGSAYIAPSVLSNFNYEPWGHGSSSTKPFETIGQLVTAIVILTKAKDVIAHAFPERTAACKEKLFRCCTKSTRKSSVTDPVSGTNDSQKGLLSQKI